MSLLNAVLSALWRSVSSWKLVLWLWLSNFIVALPLAWVMSESLRAAIGPSLAHEDLRQGFDVGWFGEFEAEARGMEDTFTPTVLGAGAFFNNLESWLSGGLFALFPGLVGVGILYALLWAFLLGGVLESFATRSPFTLPELVAAGGRHFLRFVRLALIAAVFYYLVYRFSGWLLETIAERSRDVTSETRVFIAVAAAFALTALLLAVVHMAFDYAKIATVLESRRSAALAALRGFGFVFSHPAKTLGLYLSLAAVGGLLLGGYWLVAPGAGQSTVVGVALAFLVGQLYLVLKLMLRLGVLGGEMGLYTSVHRPRAVSLSGDVQSRPRSGSAI